jgi:FHA domain
VTLKIVHTFGKHAGSTQTVDKQVVRLGRAPDGDVVFDPEFDRDASGNHAEARRQGAGWLLVDLKSRNGTFVNGERVEQRPLTSGDEVTFGIHGPRVRFEFGSNTSQGLRRPVPSTGTVPAPPGDLPRSVAVPPDAPQASLGRPPAGPQAGTALMSGVAQAGTAMMASAQKPPVNHHAAVSMGNPGGVPQTPPVTMGRRSDSPKHPAAALAASSRGAASR